MESHTCTPPTVAGPIRILLCLRAYAMSFLVSASGTPSAITATTRMVGCFMASMLDSYALHKRNSALCVLIHNVLKLLCAQPSWDGGKYDKVKSSRTAGSGSLGTFCTHQLRRMKGVMPTAMWKSLSMTVEEDVGRQRRLHACGRMQS